jgi:hypothetical protein
MANLTGGSGWDALAATPAGEIEFALKNFYLPGMEEQKNNARVLLANIERNEKDVSGSKAYVPVLLGRNWGIGMRRDRETLPTPQYQRGDRAEVDMRYAFGRLMITLHAMAATKNRQGSYDTVLDVETEGLMEDLPKDINRQLFMDGTAYIARQAGALAGAVATIDNAGISAPQNAAEYSKYFEKGQLIDVIDTTDEGDITATPNSTESVVASSTANTVTFEAAPTSADNDLFVLSGNHYQEVTGLQAMVSATGTYQGINRATAGNERWKANSVTGTGDITESYLQQVWTACQKASGMDPTMILGTYEARDKYAAILQADRRFVNTIDYKGGFKGPEFHGVGLIPDPDCMRGKLFFLNIPYIAIYQQAGLQFMDDDGAILFRSAGYAAYEATLYWFFELGTRRCNVHGILTGCNQ